MSRALVLTSLALALTGCAATSARNTRTAEQMLAGAGFRAMPADTPEKLAHLTALPPGKIIHREQHGTASYVYADPHVCKCFRRHGTAVRAVSKARTRPAEGGGGGGGGRGGFRPAGLELVGTVAVAPDQRNRSSGARRLKYREGIKAS